MAKRLDPDIRASAEQAQARRNAARERVANQEIIGLRFMSEEAVKERIAANVLKVFQGGEKGQESLADVLNYGLELLGRAEGATDDGNH